MWVIDTRKGLLEYQKSWALSYLSLWLPVNSRTLHRTLVKFQMSPQRNEMEAKRVIWGLLSSLPHMNKNLITKKNKRPSHRKRGKKTEKEAWGWKSAKQMLTWVFFRVPRSSTLCFSCLDSHPCAFPPFLLAVYWNKKPPSYRACLCFLCFPTFLSAALYLDSNYTSQFLGCHNSFSSSPLWARDMTGESS